MFYIIFHNKWVSRQHWPSNISWCVARFSETRAQQKEEESYVIIAALFVLLISKINSDTIIKLSFHFQTLFFMLNNLNRHNQGNIWSHYIYVFCVFVLLISIMANNFYHKQLFLMTSLSFKDLSFLSNLKKYIFHCCCYC